MSQSARLHDRAGALREDRHGLNLAAGGHDGGDEDQGAEVAVVLHYEADFEHIATVTAQPLSWIAPRGSLS